MDINKKIAEELEIKVWQVEAVVKLVDEGNTIPFIARYRKEQHGALNDEQLRNLHERLIYLRNLEEKKEQVLASIEEQGKLTDELKAQILAAQTQVVVDDLYRPYRPKRRTRAIIAKEKGLEGLAKALQLRFYANINNDELIFGRDGKTLIYRTLDCHVQTARRRKQMEYHPCKSVGIIEYSGFAAAIDERITCECLSCYPDITDSSCCCAWQFTLNE